MAQKINSVSVIVPSYYRYQTVGDVLECLTKQTRVPDEVIVPDQTPLSERPQGFYEKYAGKLNLTVLDIEKPSITAPRNKAARGASGDVLLFLDDDVLFGEDFVAAHLEVMSEENVDVVNGAVTLKEKLPDDYPWDARQMDPVRFFLAAPNHHWQGMMLGISSCNFSIRRDWFLRVGGFDEHLPRMVDFEIGYRLFRAGAKIYYSDRPFARHLRAAGGSRKNPKNHNRLVGALYIHRKHFPGWITTQFFLKQIFGSLFQPWRLVTPLKPFRAAVRLLSANREVKQRLAQAKAAAQKQKAEVARRSVDKAIPFMEAA